MSVSIPPAIEAYDSGRSSFDGDVPCSCARSRTIGSRTATAAVLLMMPESGPTSPMVAPSCLCSLSPVYEETVCCRRWMAPVRRTPSLRIIIARMVIVAGFEKPETPSRGETPVHGPRTMSVTMMPMAVTSIGTGSVTNSTSATRMIAKTSATPTGSTAIPSPSIRAPRVSSWWADRSAAQPQGWTVTDPVQLGEKFGLGTASSGAPRLESAPDDSHRTAATHTSQSPDCGHPHESITGLRPPTRVNHRTAATHTSQSPDCGHPHESITGRRSPGRASA
jgi:hypothetical protein